MGMRFEPVANGGWLGGKCGSGGGGGEWRSGNEIRACGEWWVARQHQQEIDLYQNTNQMRKIAYKVSREKTL